MDPLAPLPRTTGGLPGSGGYFKAAPEDFEVEEIAAYEPSGDGEHLYLWVEKRGVSTDAVVRQLARALDVSPNDIGSAGLKDTQAVTRQWISVPATVEARLAAVDDGRFQILRAERHRNKLRTGHLHGNRFRMVIRDAGSGGLERARAVAAVLRQRGLANFFGSQRFGDGGSTLQIGVELLKGQRSAGLSRAPRNRRRFLKRLALSAIQSAVFNGCLRGRVEEGILDRVVAGDVLQKVASGGLFDCTEPATDQARFDAREVVPTGPMFGPKTREARGEAARREAAVLDALGLQRDAFDRERRLMAGTRRPYVVWPDDLKVEGEDDAIEVRCSLPPGSYATVLLAELVGGVQSSD